MNCRIIVLFIFVLFIVCFLNINPVDAKISDWESKFETGAGETELYTTNTDDTSDTIAKYAGGVLAILPYLGIIFIIQIVIAGYQWMTASGNAEKVEAAKKRIIYATIGIIILAALYLIVYFIINMLSEATSYKIYSSD